MKNPELVRLFYQEILKNHPKDILPDNEHVQKLYQLLVGLFMNITEQEKIQFTTLFSRMAFAFQKYQVPSKKQFFIHQFRKLSQKIDSSTDLQTVYALGIKANTDAIKVFYDDETTDDKDPIYLKIEQIIPKSDIFHFAPADIKQKSPFLRVVILSIDSHNEQLIGVDEDNNEPIAVRYNLVERNENFKDSIAFLKHFFSLPITMHLLDNEIVTGTDEQGKSRNIIRPKAFVIEPDHLVDVTAIADCFRQVGTEPLLYLLKKFMPYEASPSIMKGNIANFFLDELIANPEVTFQETIPKTFKINPLAFCTFEEKEFRDIIDASKGHFVNIRRMVIEGLPKEGITRENCYLEPSFYSPKYGLQGRLDLFYHNPDNNKSAIVELKSGKPFKPNAYGISANHFTQTLLYDLLVSAAFEGKTAPLNYILYSVLEKDNLKYAPSVRAQQYEALNIRNQIVGLEQALININKKQEQSNGNIVERMLRKLSTTAQGYERNHIETFDKIYRQMSELENQYFHTFSSFIAREHQLAKVGVEGIENINGIASLWLNDIHEKEENFDIFSYLTIKDNKSAETDALVVFEKTDKTNPLANFRIGDIVVLYPASDAKAPILNNQIFKCTLVAMDKTSITLRLRSRQLNQHIFETTQFWNVEHDLLDSGFTGMYRSLLEFMRCPKHNRDILLTLIPPQKPTDEPQNIPEIMEMTDEQNRIFKKVIQSKDYFLLWGPPGTGKTSVMLKHFVGYYLRQSSDNILLLAYTNRAVDEICEAIESLGDWVKKMYSRIGSRYSTAPQYHEQLLDSQIASVATRKELKEIIQNKRVFVGTVSSISGKPELMQLTHFHRVIIDEASQILEPMLVGLLPHFEHFTLIGDHKQLPAVVTQSESESAMQSDLLSAVGLNNLRNSLFERLYKRANTEGWHWAFDVLSHQGRMHLDIMNFPGKYFYENKLQVLPSGMNDFQLQSLDIKSTEPFNHQLVSLIQEKRVLFINTDTDKNNNFNKTNRKEAQMIGELVKTFTQLYRPAQSETDSLTLSASKPSVSIGVITPYRAQIAQIQSVLREMNYDVDTITIDTVERYQGGARDVILISLCTNEASQLQSLVSLSEEGVDRKLNVALTRARRHLVVVGNVDILRGSEIYKWFIDEYYTLIP